MGLIASSKPKLNHVLLGMQIQSVEIENIKKVRKGTIQETVSHAPATLYHPFPSYPINHSILPLSQLNNPFVPSLSQTLLCGTRNLKTNRVKTIVPNTTQTTEKKKRRKHSRISINQKHIQRQQPQLGGQLPNLIIPQIQLLHLPPRHLPITLKLLRNGNEPI